MSRFVLPTSVTMAPGASRAASAASVATLTATGAHRTTRSAAAAADTSLAVSVTAPSASALTSTSRASMPMTRTPGHVARAANPTDPPMRPTPTMAMVRNGGSAASLAAPLDAPVDAPVDLGNTAIRLPARADGRVDADAASDRRRDDPQLRHQAIELAREQRLRAVAPRLVRIAVHLDQQAVGAGRD